MQDDIEEEKGSEAKDCLPSEDACGCSRSEWWFGTSYSEHQWHIQDEE